MDPEDTLVDIIEAVYDRAMLKTGRNTFNMKKYLEENKFKMKSGQGGWHWEMQMNHEDTQR